MACDSVVWRDEMGLDTIFENPEPTILEIAKTLNEGWAHKCDREGRPILVDQVIVGVLVVLELCSAVSSSRFLIPVGNKHPLQ